MDLVSALNACRMSHGEPSSKTGRLEVKVMLICACITSGSVMLGASATRCRWHFASVKRSSNDALFRVYLAEVAVASIDA